VCTQAVAKMLKFRERASDGEEGAETGGETGGETGVG